MSEASFLAKQFWMSLKMIYSVFVLIMLEHNILTCEVTAWRMFSVTVPTLIPSPRFAGEIRLAMPSRFPGTRRDEFLRRGEIF